MIVNSGPSCAVLFVPISLINARLKGTGVDLVYGLMMSLGRFNSRTTWKQEIVSE